MDRSSLRSGDTRLNLFVISCGLLLVITACSTDPLSPSDCDGDETWDEAQEECIGGSTPGDDAGHVDTNSTTPNQTNNTPNTGPNSTPNSGNNTNNTPNNGEEDTGNGEPACVNLECDQVACPSDAEPTSLSGTVHIPSGDLPLPNVTVYVPNAELDDITEGVSCERCEDMVTGNPLVQTTTDMRGDFHLSNVPAGDNIPLVMQTGKWRRKVEISTVEECTENEITDQNLTRLPRNQSEGNIPRIAVSTGGWDALECLIYEIGLDDQEFGTENDASGRVTLFAGNHGGHSEFASHFHGGASFTSVSNWWNDFENLAEYDIVMHSCDYPDPSVEATEALEQFANEGGRAFMTDLHREWFEYGTADFQSVANWQTPIAYPGVNMSARLDLSPPGAGMMFDWMDALGRFDVNDQFDVQSIQKNIGSVNTGLAERWLYSPDGATGQRDLYFAFNTPVGAGEDDQCGRVVYSDLHVAAGGGADPNQRFPDSCTGTMSTQEEALVYMFFDLAACIAPDCIPVTCSDVPDNCGTHPNECGGTIDCGECCEEIDEPCEVDEDCCDSLWCDDNTGLCTDRCRDPGERCDQNSDCCSNVCDESAGDDGECIEL